MERLKLGFDGKTGKKTDRRFKLHDTGCSKKLSCFWIVLLGMLFGTLCWSVGCLDSCLELQSFNCQQLMDTTIKENTKSVRFVGKE